MLVGKRSRCPFGLHEHGLKVSTVFGPSHLHLHILQILRLLLDKVCNALLRNLQLCSTEAAASKVCGP